MQIIECDASESSQTSAQIQMWLSGHSRELGYDYDPQPLVLKIELNDQIVAGLCGKTNWDWLYVETLAVEQNHRGAGLASKLLHEAERIAIQRGCHGSWLDTYTFQAVEFYKKLGYQVFGQLNEYPNNESRYFLFKDLISG